MYSLRKNKVEILIESAKRERDTEDGMYQRVSDNEENVLRRYERVKRIRKRHMKRIVF